MVGPVNATALHSRQGVGPVLKWAGGKGQLLRQYAGHFPRSYRAYYEPFVGSAAVFFHLKPTARKRVRLSDINPELVNFYCTLRDRLEPLIRRLAEHQLLHCPEHYYAVRALRTEELDPVERAARLMYLNKTCYNGLYRVNSRGDFNVPVGRYKNPGINPEERLRAASRALEGVELEVAPFASVLEHAREKDLVYFDPPYQPLSPTSNFTSYTAASFSEADQRRLAEIFRELDRRGARVMLSNSNAPLIQELYAEYRPVHIQANRCINSKANGRSKIVELLVTNFRR
ncbi:MAG: DNA adenine methylase [Armatimonadetes bacterium]|nr:DNA adenine methylase [Armatimonadota bacterium]